MLMKMDDNANYPDPKSLPKVPWYHREYHIFLLGPVINFFAAVIRFIRNEILLTDPSELKLVYLDDEEKEKQQGKNKEENEKENTKEKDKDKEQSKDKEQDNKDNQHHQEQTNEQTQPIPNEDDIPFGDNDTFIDEDAQSSINTKKESKKENIILSNINDVKKEIDSYIEKQMAKMLKEYTVGNDDKKAALFEYTENAQNKLKDTIKNNFTFFKSFMKQEGFDNSQIFKRTEDRKSTILYSKIEEMANLHKKAFAEMDVARRCLYLIDKGKMNIDPALINEAKEYVNTKLPFNQHISDITKAVDDRGPKLGTVFAIYAQDKQNPTPVLYGLTSNPYLTDFFKAITQNKNAQKDNQVTYTYSKLSVYRDNNIEYKENEPKNIKTISEIKGLTESVQQNQDGKWNAELKLDSNSDKNYKVFQNISEFYNCPPETAITCENFLLKKLQAHKNIVDVFPNPKEYQDKETKKYDTDRIKEVLTQKGEEYIKNIDANYKGENLDYAVSIIIHDFLQGKQGAEVSIQSLEMTEHGKQLIEENIDLINSLKGIQEPEKQNEQNIETEQISQPESTPIIEDNSQPIPVEESPQNNDSNSEVSQTQPETTQDSEMPFSVGDDEDSMFTTEEVYKLYNATPTEVTPQQETSAQSNTNETPVLSEEILDEVNGALEFWEATDSQITPNNAIIYDQDNTTFNLSFHKTEQDKYTISVTSDNPDRQETPLDLYINYIEQNEFTANEVGPIIGLVATYAENKVNNSKQFNYMYEKVCDNLSGRIDMPDETKQAIKTNFDNACLDLMLYEAKNGDGQLEPKSLIIQLDERPPLLRDPDDKFIIDIIEEEMKDNYRTTDAIQRNAASEIINDNEQNITKEKSYDDNYIGN